MSVIVKKIPPITWIYAAAILLVILIAAYAGSMYYGNERQKVYEEGKKDLATVARLKQQQIEDWRDERLGDARLLMHDAPLALTVKNFIRNPHDQTLKRNIRQWLDSYRIYNKYYSVLLVAVTGKTVMESSEGIDSIGERLAQIIPFVAQTHSVFLSELHQTVIHKKLHFDLVAPLLLQDKQDTTVVATVVLRINPYQNLFPLIQSWPVDNRTSEALLFRIENDSVVFLNNLRHKRIVPLTFRLPISQTNLPAAMLATGREGFAEGKDYRGKAVLAYLLPIHHSSWYMVTKIDMEEIEERIKAEMNQELIFIFLIVLAIGSLLGMMWRHQRAAYYKRESQAKQQSRLLLAQMIEMIVYHEIVYDKNRNPIDYRILDCNSVFTDVTGISKEKAVGALASELYGTGEPPYFEIYSRVAQMQQPEKFETYFPPMDKYFMISVFSDAPGKFVTITSDVTEQKKHEKSLRWQKQLYAILSEINQAIVWLKDKESLFTEACRIAVETGDMNMAWIGLYDASKGVITPAAFNGIGKDEFYEMHNNFTAIDNTRLCYRAIGQKRTVVLNTLDEIDHDRPTWKSFAVEHGYRAMAAFPFFRHDVPIGVMVMFSDEKNFFTEEVVNLLEEMSLDISFAMETFESNEAKKNTEDKLRESEKNYRQLTEYSTNGIMIHVDGTIVYANRSAAKILGVEETEHLLGRRVMDFVHPDFKKSVVDRINTVVENDREVSAIEEKLQRVDGTTIYSEVAAIPFEFQGKKAVQVVFSDITKRKQAEDALVAERTLLATIVENLPVALYIKDKKGRKLLSNPKDLENIGKPASEVIGKTDQEVLSNEFAEQTLIDDEKIFMSGDYVINSEELLINAQGKKQWLLTTKIPYRNKSGDIIGLIGMGLDITSHKKSENEIRILSRAIEQSPVSVVITNSHGDIEYVNPKFSQISGYSLKEVIGQNPRILKSGETSASTYKNMWETISSGTDWHGQFHNKKKNGELYWENVFVSPVRDQHGTITHYLAVKEDITEMKKIQDQLLQSQKVESIGTLASGIAHDFNNVLGIILAYTGFLNRWTGDEKILQNSVSEINKAVDRGANLVRQILTFARKTETTFRPMSLKDLVKEIVSMMNQTLPKVITIESHVEKNLPYITADRTKIHQAIVNLCVNARDAMPNGGRLTISVSMKQRDQLPHTMQTDDHPRYIAISVSDTGMGIDEKIQNQVFDPFFTTKELGKGTGLGLSVVYGVVESHKGLIDLQSDVGKGTTFTIYLPFDDDGFNAAEPEEVSAETVPGGDETILLVEDELPLLMMVKEILEEKGYTVLTATDGDTAVEMFSLHRFRIHLVLTDMGLPKRTGTEVFKQLKMIDPDVKIIFASGYFEPKVKSELEQAGAIAFVDKPYQVLDILQKIRSILDDQT